MRQHTFENHYRQTWLDFASQLDRLETGNKKQLAAAKQEDINFPESYQSICQHLAIAESRYYSPTLINYLQQLVQRGHRVLYQHRSNFWLRIIQFIIRDFPQCIRQEKKLILTATALFYGSALVSALITFYFPDFIYVFMSTNDIYDLESMYDPSSQVIRPLVREGDENWFMFAYYINNNISIAFVTFAGGIIFCLGTLYYLLINGIIIGIVATHLSVNGYADTFWPFVIGHGSFELTAIVIAAAAGLKLGLAILIPQRKTRLEALRYTAKTAINLVIGAFIMLLIAAFIEAYWSSMNSASHLRFAVGILLWIAVISYFLFTGKTRQSHETN
ncbi:stage II sporulation protein M [Entomomonas asaccharolytica]|uniref:Stage II sporulation protein M n=1 Tax=Entomomonas asaccharolytica TaxID=2785331 RepID=A0A974RXR7_9GAMM|nr:stage II sporulation protein M [Entomomonas asaccharolytica]QQP85159.1 stage II sporulation protein M [Entomomonas asaccharolytica]